MFVDFCTKFRMKNKWVKNWGMTKIYSHIVVCFPQMSLN